MKPTPQEGQIWRDTDRRYEGRRFVRIDKIEQRGLWRVARISSRLEGEDWKTVSRFIRLDRIPKRYRFVKEK
jgi:hypothetical protein